MTMLVGSLFAIGTSVFIGLSDFLAGYLTRRMSTFLVLGLANLTAAVLIGIFVFHRGLMTMGPSVAVTGTIYGLSELVGNLLYIYALSRGSVGVISGVSTLVVLPPVIYAFASGMAPSFGQSLGVIVLLLGVVMLGWPQEGGTKTSPKIIGIACVGVLISGLGDVSLSIGSSMDPALAAFFGFALAPIAVVAGLIVNRRARRTPATDLPGEPMRIDPAMDRRVLAVLTGVAVVAAGVMFLLRDVSFAFALSYTNVGVAAALSALDPLIIAPLGYFFLKERMTRIQVGGLGVALIGSVLALVG